MRGGRVQKRLNRWAIGSLILTVAVFVCVYGSLAGQRANADSPVASRLLDENLYDSSNNFTPGVTVNISSPSFNLGGLANDGTTVYMLDGNNGNIYTVPFSAINMSAGSVNNLTATQHAVNWGQNGAPSLPNNLLSLSIVYSHGCLFITNGDNSTNADLYCISTSDYNVSQVAVPGAHPLPVGHSYTFSSMVAFPDGRIGKVSEYEPDGSGGYISTLRTYTVSGTGSSASIAWSKDYLMADPDNWATDEHGIATDGTYLYRIQWWQVSPYNFKSWQLQDGSTASIAFEGNFTRPFQNMHYLSYDATDHRYMAGFFNSSPYPSATTGFFLTDSANPGPGPGNPLIPTFGNINRTAGGYTVQITNYDSSFA